MCVDWCLNILFQPFWPTGSGCARGFLSSFDACWAVKSWGSGQATPLDVLAERESVYRLLGQTTPENLQRDTTSYTLDPHTRYTNLNTRCVLPFQVQGLYDADDPTSVEQCLVSAVAQEMPKKRRRKGKALHWCSLVQLMFQLILQLTFSFNLLPRAFLVAVQHVRTCWTDLWLRDVRFSCSGVKDSCGLYVTLCHWVSSWAVSYVLRDPTTFIYRCKQAFWSFNTVGTAHPVTQHCPPRRYGSGSAAAPPLSEPPISHSITIVTVYLVFHFESSLLHFGLSDCAVTGWMAKEMVKSHKLLWH